MSKLKNPLLSLGAVGNITKALTFLRRRKTNIVESYPLPKDAKSLAQLSWRHMYQKAIALWHALSASEQQEWESLARPKHMTGFAWFISQALRPNPGIYLPLQGGTMQGIIDMDGFKISDLLDPVAVQDADTKAARDAAIAAAIGGSLTCDIHGYDGSNWQKLLVESAAQHNLRVRLYDGPNGIASTPTNIYLAASQRGLVTASVLYAYNDDLSYPALLRSRALADAVTPIAILEVGSHLLGFNGTFWDRLRSYGTGILKVGRAEIDSTTVRKTGAGAVIGGARKLFWVSCSPDSPGAEFELTDAIAGGGPVVYDHFDPDKHSEHLNFDPPLKFTTGIWIEKFDHIHSLVFCYT